MGSLQSLLAGGVELAARLRTNSRSMAPLPTFSISAQKMPKPSRLKFRAPEALLRRTPATLEIKQK